MLCLSMYLCLSVHVPMLCLSIYLSRLSICLCTYAMYVSLPMYLCFVCLFTHVISVYLPMLYLSIYLLCLSICSQLLPTSSFWFSPPPTSRRCPFIKRKLQSTPSQRRSPSQRRHEQLFDVVRYWPVNNELTLFYNLVLCFVLINPKRQRYLDIAR